MSENTIPFAKMKDRPIQLEVKPWHKAPKGKNGLTCRHTSYLIDRDMAYVECADCGEHLNPMEVLLKLATHESRFRERRQALVDEQARWDAKSKVKCQHCGKFTKLR